MAGEGDSVTATAITITSISTLVSPITTTTWPPITVISNGITAILYTSSDFTTISESTITSTFTPSITTENIGGTSTPTTTSVETSTSITKGPTTPSTTEGPTTPATQGPTASSGSNTSKAVPARLAGGIAVICFFVGVAIASFLVYFIISRRERRYRYSHFNDGSEDPRGSGRAAEKSLASATISIPQDSSAAIVENHLPQPVEDNAIKSELSKLKDRVNDHIQSYYDLAKMREPVAAQDIQRALGNVSSVPLEKFSRLLADPRTRPVILRNGLAWIILSRVGLECDPSISFLPRHVVSCVHDMLQARMNDGVRMAFLSKWRSITSTLLQSTYGQPTTIEADPRNESVHKAMQVADIILRPYVDERADNAARLYNLEEIMRRAVRFAYTLFSHPSFWRFDWHDTREGIVVFPALLQLTNEDGAPLGSPRLFSENVVIRV